VAGFVPPGPSAREPRHLFQPVRFLYNFLYAIIIVFFTYFYTAVVLNRR